MGQTPISFVLEFPYFSPRKIDLYFRVSYVFESLSTVTCSRPNISLALSVITIVVTNAQVIPDLTKGDNYRPYLSENEKRTQILQTSPPHAMTSQELYPELYKNVNENYLEPIKGTPADPKNAFNIQARVGFNKTSNNAGTPNNLNPTPSGVYQPGLSIEQRNKLMVESDMTAFESQKQGTQQILDETNKELYKPAIKYNLGIHTNPNAERFAKAYLELNAMLDGKQKIDFLKAVWLVESSFDISLSWKEFNGMFQDDVQIISQLIVKDKLSPTDNLAKIMSIFKFMADTTTVFIKSKEKNITSKPMLYDFDDFAAKKDPTKVFVSKLLRTGSGQCMSLPMLYYLFAKALGAEVYIAFAPQHSYITFKDRLGNWQNIELTAKMFMSSDFNWQSGFIKADQVRSGIYLTPITEKETIAYLLTTLALTYVKAFGTDDLVLEMGLTAKKYSPKSLTPNMIITGYSMELWKNVLRQYEVYGLNEGQLVDDEKAQEIKKKRDELVDYIYKDLGYTIMPDDAYKKWLAGVNELARKQQHIVRKRQLEQQLKRY